MTTVKARMIEFPSDAQTTPAYLAQPDAAGAQPALVVIQEWWGLVPHIKDVAGRFAREGFITLAPDLYHGQVAEEPDEARKLAMGLDRNRAVAEITAAAEYLKAMGQVSPKKIGVVGWCMGGGLALSTAASSSNIGAAVAFYGRPLDAGDTAKLAAPVLGLYAELDQSIPVPALRAFEQELKAHNVTHEIHIYPGAQHAFFNETRPHIYHAEAARDAWQKTLAWFRRYLV
jgi:carboxymethylenebutenolidase